MKERTSALCFTVLYERESVVSRSSLRFDLSKTQVKAVASDGTIELADAMGVAVEGTYTSARVMVSAVGAMLNTRSVGNTAADLPDRLRGLCDPKLCHSHCGPLLAFMLDDHSLLDI